MEVDGDETLLLGLDLGTSGAKAGVFDLSGRLLGIGRGAYPVDRPKPGWAQTDPEAWWRGSCEAIRGAIASARANPRRIAAAGLSVLFPAVALLDAEGRPLSAAILYCDQRSLAQVEAIEAAIPRRDYEAITGNVLAPGNCAATSIAWLRDELPDAWRAARWIGFAGSCLLLRLVGKPAVDPTQASLSGLVDIGSPHRWNADLARRIGIEPGRLPPIAASHEVIGTLGRHAAGETGLAAGTPVVCGCGDTPAATLGTGVARPGAAVCSTGSTDSLAVPLEQPTRNLLWVGTAHATPGLWLAIGTISSTGASVDWFASEILGERGAGRRVSELAAMSKPGAGGVVFLPYLQGERTPLWDPLARGAFFGLTSSTRREDMARAVLEGAGFALRTVVESLDPGAGRSPALGRLILSGGGASSRVWNQLKADILGRPLEVGGSGDAAALGAALLAGLGVGLYGSIDDAAEIGRTRAALSAVEPDPALRKTYDELYGIFRELYPATRELAHGLASRT